MMNEDRWRRITEVFDAVVEEPTEARDRLLENACAGDPSLRSDVDDLLRSYDDDPRFLEPPAGEGRAGLSNAAAIAGVDGGHGAGGEDGPDGGRGAHAPAGERLGVRARSPADEAITDPLEGTLVGRYRIERRVGAGGMGAVYLARREGDFEQVAAIKVLRRGLDTEQILERFRSERQILAALHHPNVAHLLDGGMTDDGRPYFAMEYIDGEPIDRYCESRGLTLRERLDLFMSVCRAVHHAHQNLVVHRDLKPSNILVTREGHAKLLDFGIAKIFDPERGDDAQTVTRPEGRAFTPEYASPEQARGEPITTATDVYSLGVLLYELLAGTRPYRLRTGTPAEIADLAERASTPPPSVAAAGARGSGDGSGKGAGDSGSAARWRAQLRGDLDTIVMKAMHREAVRRYSSAEAFAEDLDRYLRGLPVAAQKDSVGYRVRRFVGRNRVGVAAASAFAILLVVFSAVTWLQSRRIAAERSRAESERATAEQAVDVLADLFERSNPLIVPGGDTTTVATLIGIGEERLDEMDAQPALQARLSRVFADIHQARGRPEKAREFLERELAIERTISSAGASDSAETLHLIARTVAATEGPEAAEPLLRESVERFQRALGDGDITVIQAKQDLAENLTNFEERKRLMTGILEELRAAHPDSVGAIAAAANALANAHFERREFAKARPLYEEALGILDKLVSKDHPHRLVVLNNLSATVNSLGDWKAAESHAREALESARRVLGPVSEQAGSLLEMLGGALENQGRYAEAERAYRESLSILEKHHEPGYWRIASEAQNLARAIARQGRYAEAMPLYERAVAIGDSAGLGPPLRGVLHANLACNISALGRNEEAIATARVALATIHEENPPSDEVALINVEASLAYLLLVSGEADQSAAAAREAEELYRGAMVLRERALSPSHPSVAESRIGVALALAAQGRDAEAAALLEPALATYRAWAAADPRLLALAVATSTKLTVGAG